MTGNKQITISGAGVNGQGALFNSGGVQYDQGWTLLWAVTQHLAPPAVAVATGTWAMVHIDGPYKVTINNPMVVMVNGIR